jgi:hypothetical protein
LARKGKISWAWYLVMIIAAGGFLMLSVIQQRIVAAEKVLAIYQRTPACLNSDPCKQILQVKIKQIETKLLERFVSSWVPKSPKIQLPTLAKNYVLAVYLPNKGIQSAIIIPGILLDTKNFSYKNIYLPNSNDQYFAVDNFQQEDEIKVEIWESQITLVFTNSIKGYLAQNPTENIAIPTASHPQVILSLAQQDSNNVFIGTVIILTLMILVAIWFSK